MLLMVVHIVWVNQDIIQIDDYRDVQDIKEDIIYKMLEGQQSIW